VRTESQKSRGRQIQLNDDEGMKIIVLLIVVGVVPSVSGRLDLRAFQHDDVPYAFGCRRGRCGSVPAGDVVAAAACRRRRIVVAGRTFAGWISPTTSTVRWSSTRAPSRSVAAATTTSTDVFRRWPTTTVE